MEFIKYYFKETIFNLAMHSRNSENAESGYAIKNGKRNTILSYSFFSLVILLYCILYFDENVLNIFINANLTERAITWIVNGLALAVIFLIEIAILFVNYRIEKNDSIEESYIFYKSLKSKVYWIFLNELYLLNSKKKSKNLKRYRLGLAIVIGSGILTIIMIIFFIVMVYLMHDYNNQIKSVLVGNMLLWACGLVYLTLTRLLVFIFKFKYYEVE